MSRADKRRRGACPAAGAPLESGDGLISRLRLPTGRLTAAELNQLADQAQAHGRGLLEITSRGNIQFRGLNESSEEALAGALAQAGLADPDPATEGARNIQSTPAGDRDPQARTDTAPSAARLDGLIRSDAAFRALPPKFRFVLNGGGVLHLGAADGDIRADAVRRNGEVIYRLALAGTAARGQYLGLCPAARLPEQLAALAHVLVQLNADRVTPVRRLDEALRTYGIEPFRQAVESGAKADPGPPEEPPRAEPGATSMGLLAGLPFGRLDAATARALARMVRRYGAGEVRITPRRQLLLPGVPATEIARLDEHDLITEAGDARNAIVACPGAPDCASASTATRADAEAWARAVPQLFDGETRVHVSGCDKGCARPGPAPVTLTARAGGYELILNDRARPGQEKSRITRDLPPDQVPPYLRDLVQRAEAAREPNEALTSALQRLAEIAGK